MYSLHLPIINLIPPPTLHPHRVTPRFVDFNAHSYSLAPLNKPLIIKREFRLLITHVYIGQA